MGFFQNFQRFHSYTTQRKLPHRKWHPLNGWSRDPKVPLQQLHSLILSNFIYTLGQALMANPMPKWKWN